MMTRAEARAALKSAKLVKVWVSVLGDKDGNIHDGCYVEITKKAAATIIDGLQDDGMFLDAVVSESGSLRIG